ncbi:MAG: nucleotidyl transferase AbiEii/AbiGii toxin family protein [Pseudomonadota bacterium]|nr:nucleotidyl transferase AbiEii/AbiGii toxin family protein [Pseudomonadota bacterium]
MRNIYLSHELILKALNDFNSEYLRQHNILFGGGTRIALELGEFRESIDIDFLCLDKNSFRAVRNQVQEDSLGKLLKNSIDILKLRTDRMALKRLLMA